MSVYKFNFNISLMFYAKTLSKLELHWKFNNQCIRRMQKKCYIKYSSHNHFWYSKKYFGPLSIMIKYSEANAEQMRQITITSSKQALWKKNDDSASNARNFNYHPISQSYIEIAVKLLPLCVYSPSIFSIVTMFDQSALAIQFSCESVIQMDEKCKWKHVCE